MNFSLCFRSFARRKKPNKSQIIFGNVNSSLNKWTRIYFTLWRCLSLRCFPQCPRVTESKKRLSKWQHKEPPHILTCRFIWNWLENCCFMQSISLPLMMHISCTVVVTERVRISANYCRKRLAKRDGKPPIAYFIVLILQIDLLLGMRSATDWGSKKEPGKEPQN